MLNGKIMFGLAVALALLGGTPAAWAARLTVVNPCGAAVWNISYATNGTANALKAPHVFLGSGCSVQIECDTTPGVIDNAAPIPSVPVAPGQFMAGFACPASSGAIGLRPLGGTGNYRFSFEP